MSHAEITAELAHRFQFKNTKHGKTSRPREFS